MDAQLPTSNQNNEENSSSSVVVDEEEHPNQQEEQSLRSTNYNLDTINDNDNDEEENTADRAIDDTDNTNSSNIDDDATSQVTEINIPPSPSNNHTPTYFGGLYFGTHSPAVTNRLWTLEERGAYEERRRESLTQELNRVQRSNFISFSLLCMIPIVLIGLILMNSFRSDGDCLGYETAKCERNTRSFLNAFGNKCFCYAFTLEG